MQEAEIERISVPVQHRQKKFLRPISTEKSWAWWPIPVIPATAVRNKI
jgi:hypothetical protein